MTVEQATDLKVSENESPMKIGYVGLGSMGGALASRLQTTHNLVVYDLHAPSVERLTAAGAVAAENLSDLASRCDVIIMCLPTSGHVRQAIFGDGGLATSLTEGTVIIDQTTGNPRETRQMHAELAQLSVSLVDAPVSGGKHGATAGTIAIMVGASDTDYAKVHPILSAISPNVFHAGGVGNGHVIKIVNNLISTTQRLLSFEGVALAAKNGVDPEVAVEILLASGGRNAFLEKMMGPRVLKGDLAPGFTLALAHKDVNLASQLAMDSEVPLFFGNLTRELYQVAMREMGREAQVDTAALVMDRLAGTNVVPKDYRA
jgi:3-hydroxyisobutyrate dehydrogenase